MWLWLSIKPGITVRPPRSTTRVRGATNLRMSSLVPTPMNRAVWEILTLHEAGSA